MDFVYDWKHNKKKFAVRVGYIIIGNIVFALALNILIIPLNLYSGGFVGTSQLLNILATKILGLEATNLRGIIYFIINIPLFIFGYKIIGLEFCVTSLFSIGFGSVCLSLVPIPTEPIISDVLTACLIGGVISGAGAGLVLKSGSSGGGQDIVGVCLSKTHPNVRVGIISIIMNIFIFGTCFLLFNMETVVYSLIYSTLNNIFIDRVYTQNINMQVMIFTKNDTISDKVLTEIQRGVTEWTGAGAYTKEDSHILVTVVSKYELNRLIQVVRDADPNAFIVTNEGIGIYGKFQRRLS